MARVPELAARNHRSIEADRVVMVHLRQPKRQDPRERRSDPFYDFGRFGCTGCHRTNLMNPAKIGELDGVRLAMAQGGRGGFDDIAVMGLGPGLDFTVGSSGGTLRLTVIPEPASAFVLLLALVAPRRRN